METGKGMTARNKGGRPTTDPKTHDLRIRVNESMYEKVRSYSRDKGQTVTDTVRECIDGYLMGK